MDQQLVAENGLKDVELLSATNDDYEGVIVDIKEVMDSGTFLSLLRTSLSLWKQQGKKAVWLKLPIAVVNLVEPAIKEGFWYHHAEPQYLMLVNWISETANTIPGNATHRVGVGAIVINDKRERQKLLSVVQEVKHTELLVVQEKSGNFQGMGVWKIPTGVVDEGEEIFEGAVREVKEETGIDTEFIEILAFRQFHKSFFDKSDLFFLCMLRPLSFNIQKQDLEIEAAQWMPVEEYMTQPIAQKNTLFKCIAELCLAKVDKNYAGFLPLPITSFFNDKVSYLYANNHDLSK